MKTAFVFCGLLLLAILGCTKPNYSIEGSNNHSVPVLFYTSLQDTLSKKTFDQLRLTDRTLGIKINDITGLDVRYFEYEADADVLIRALAETGFDIATQMPTDITCRKLSYEDLSSYLKNASINEAFYAGHFLNSFAEGFEAYECVKSPVKHQVLVNRTSRRVYHRVERVG
jgi:hypothetical protein